MKNFLKSWQGIISTSVMVLAFCLMPLAFSALHLTSGTIDWAYLQALAFSTVVFFSAILCAWIAVQCDWKIFLNKSDVQDDWWHLTALQRTIIMQATILMLILFYILCFAFLPKP